RRRGAGRADPSAAVLRRSAVSRAAPSDVPGVRRAARAGARRSACGARAHELPEAAARGGRAARPRPAAPHAHPAAPRAGRRGADGRPVVAEWTEAEIEKRFGRDYESHAHAAPPEAL